MDQSLGAILENIYIIFNSQKINVRICKDSNKSLRKIQTFQQKKIWAKDLKRRSQNRKYKRQKYVSIISNQRSDLIMKYNFYLLLAKIKVDNSKFK